MNTIVSHTNSVLRLAYAVSKDANRNMCLLLSIPNTQQIVFF